MVGREASSSHSSNSTRKRFFVAKAYSLAVCAFPKRSKLYLIGALLVFGILNVFKRSLAVVSMWSVSQIAPDLVFASNVVVNHDFRTRIINLISSISLW